MIQSIKKYSNAIHLFSFGMYYLRVIFPVFKYIFIIAFFFSILSFILSGKPERVIDFFKKMAFPIVILVMYLWGFLYSGIGHSLIYKEIVNTLIVFFYLFLFWSKSLELKYEDFRKIVYVLIGIGSIALVRSLLHFAGMEIPFSDIFFTTRLPRFSLVADYNYYSLYFIMGYIVLFALKYKDLISNRLAYITSIIFFSNILLSHSRRAYVLVFVLYFVLLIYNILVRRKNVSIRKFVRSISLSFLTLIIIFVAFFWTFRKKILDFDRSTLYVSSMIYRLNTVAGNDKTMIEFGENMWSKVFGEKVKLRKDENNLIVNGDFVLGSKDWKYRYSEVNELKRKVVITDSTNYLRMHRVKGEGEFQLCYTGRPIYYHQGAEYTLSFDYLVDRGVGIPFSVGWWTIDGSERISDLPILSYPLTKKWKKAVVTHKFKENHDNPMCFLNSMQIGSTIKVTNIKLEMRDSLNRLPYSDQQQGYHNNNIEASMEQNALLGSRIVRWNYAREIWKDKYSLFQKIFGNGFHYLSDYGRELKGSDEVIDYPHNPILSSLLYSGVIGMIGYVFFLVMATIKYLRCAKKFFVGVLMFVVFLCFNMFSGNSHFSVPLFVFISFFPFLFSKREKNLS